MAIENRDRVEMHVHSPIFHGQLKEKVRPITILVWVLRRVEKMPKKGQKMTCIFQGLFKKVFRSVALVKKSYGLLYFFSHRPEFVSSLSCTIP